MKRNEIVSIEQVVYEEKEEHRDDDGEKRWKRRRNLFWHHWDRERKREHSVDDLISVHWRETRRNCGPSTCILHHHHRCDTWEKRSNTCAFWWGINVVAGVNRVAVTCNGYSITLLSMLLLSQNSSWIVPRPERISSHFGHHTAHILITKSTQRYRCEYMHTHMCETNIQYVYTKWRRDIEAHIHVHTQCSGLWVDWKR